MKAFASIVHAELSRIAPIATVVALAVLSARNLSAYPVVFTAQGTIGTIVSCTNTNECDPLHAAGQGFTLSGSFNTTDVPVSCGTNCNTYRSPTVTVNAPGLLSEPVVTVSDIPVNITANAAPNPDTFYISLILPSPAGAITMTALAGIPPGTITSTTPSGFGKVSFVPGTAPSYTFGSTMTYVGSQGDSTELTLTGSIDAVNVLHTFTGTTTDGGFPQSSLTELARGTFVGTTFGSVSQALAATLFNIGAGGSSFSLLHTFNTAIEGSSSAGVLLGASNAMVYGANLTGGPANTGTIYNSGLQPNTVTVLSAGLPVPSSLIEGSDTKLYGVTYSTTAPNIFFTMSLSGTVTPIYTFTANDGIPSSPVIQANDGNFYGETTGGATGNGMVYRLTKTGGPLIPVYTFTNGTDGANPNGGLFQASNGLVYGLASGGSGSSGVVFALSVNPAKPFFSVAHSFIGSDGATPAGGLIQGSDGNLYGMTSGGGANNLGTVFRLTLTNVYSVVHDFGGRDGAQPQVLGSALTLGSDGKLYGTASLSLNADGTTGAGTVFSLDRKLPKPKPVIVRFQPATGPVGTVVLVTGRNLLGISKATVNGAPASVHSRGANYAVVVIPPGATTGFISLTTANGVATSATRFVVTP